MKYLEALQYIHNIIDPKNYFEIGCRHGYSVSLAKCRSIGVDPDFEIKAPISAETRFFRQTSDSFFASKDVKEILSGPLDFSFIDGMHLVEYALRDFSNIERNSHGGGIIAVDDVLPSDIAYATRERKTQIWTGDVYRLVYILKEYRPDLHITVYDIEMKGLALISNLDPGNRILEESYDEIFENINRRKWSVLSAEEIRRDFRPVNTERLAHDLKEISNRRVLLTTNSPVIDGVSLYIDLLKKSILNEIYLDDELRILYLKSCIHGNDVFDPEVLHDIRNKKRDTFNQLVQSRSAGQFFERNIGNAGFNHSMMGRMRLDNLHHAMDVLLENSIPGDFIECGVWRGGGCIFMAGYLRAHGATDRRVIVADSFEGLPEPTNANDAGLDLSKAKFPQLAVSLETVMENFSAYGLEGSNIVYLKGWFKDTLSDTRTEKIALLRMDGDLYESTIDILHALYDKVSPGGVVIIDDYNAIPACKKAVEDYFISRNETVPQLMQIDWTGVWFRKPSQPEKVTAS